MMGKTIRSRLTMLVSLILVVSICACTIIASVAFIRTIKRSTYDRLALQATYVASSLANRKGELDTEWLQLYADSTSTRVTLIRENGEVLFDSDYDETLLDNHALREEVLLATQNGSGSSERESATQNLPVLYFALSVTNIPGVHIVRVSNLLQELHDYNTAYFLLTLAGIAIILAVSTIATIVSVRFLTTPLQRIIATSKAHAQGNLDATVYVEYPEELFELATSMNAMAVTLRNNIAQIERERQQYSEILDAMTEGIVYINAQLMVVQANRAACRLLLGPKEPEHNLKGMRLVQIAGAPEILQSCKSTIADDSTHELEIDHFTHLFGESARLMGKRATRILHIVCNPMRSLPEQTDVSGIVMTINDVTEFKKLEAIRKEFVANVSHELKTPITAITGFIDALLDPEIQSDVQSIQRFLSIIKRQAVRMQHIVEDLLLLSSLEQHNAHPTMVWTHIEEIVEGVQEAYRFVAGERHTDVHIVVDNQENLPLYVNGMLMIQALANVIVNAITYSDEHSQVSVSIHIDRQRAVFSVTDHGYGIPQDAIEHIFERFYRVDKARSRRQGGTGLGLSIVKHIVQVHRGTIDVESKEHVGSTFTITLPSLDSLQGQTLP